MRPLACIAILLLAAGSQEPDAALTLKVRDLIVKLRDRSLPVRQKAEEDLFGLGPPILPILRAEEAGLKPGDLKFKLGVVIKRIERHRRTLIAVGKTLIVTVSAADKPVVEVLAELQKKTAVPIESRAVAPDARVTLEAADKSLWEAVDQVCAAHGKLNWDVSEKGIAIRKETYLRPFYTTTSGYLLLVRPFRRHPPGPGTGDREYLSADILIAGPPGASLSAQVVTFESMFDDKATNLLASPSGLANKPLIGGFRLTPSADAARPAVPSVWAPVDASPARGTTKVKNCKGKATIEAVLEFEMRVDVKGANLSRGGKGTGYGFTLDIDGLDVTGERARVDVTITDGRIESRREERVTHPRYRGRIVLRDSKGNEVQTRADPLGDYESVGSPVTQEKTRYKVLGTLKDGATLAAVEVWEASQFETTTIPFEFTDIPMRKVK